MLGLSAALRSAPPLQTQPGYLARLLFQVPQNKSTTFLQPVIFTLFGYASHPREGFLLLQLFKAALQEEIRLGGGGVTPVQGLLW